MKYIVIDPVILNLGIVKIHWYGVMYLLAFLAAYLLAKYRANLTQEWSSQHVDDLIFFGALGAVLGGRLGYMVFYSLPSFLANPLIFLDFQNGGMSFHGGFFWVFFLVNLFNRYLIYLCF